MAEWFWMVAAWLGTLVGPGDTDAACLLLGGLDLARAEALAAGDPDGLERVYASAALREIDARLVAAYADRGLVLGGATVQRLSCHAVQQEPDRVVLDVVDRLGPTWVVRDGRASALPVDEPTRHVVTLVREEGRWRIAASR